MALDFGKKEDEVKEELKEQKRESKKEVVGGSLPEGELDYMNPVK